MRFPSSQIISEINSGSHNPMRRLIGHGPSPARVDESLPSSNTLCCGGSHNALQWNWKGCLACRCRMYGSITARYTTNELMLCSLEGLVDREFNSFQFNWPSTTASTHIAFNALEVTSPGRSSRGAHDRFLSLFSHINGLGNPCKGPKVDTSAAAQLLVCKSSRSSLLSV